MHHTDSFENFRESDKVFSNPLFNASNVKDKPEEMESNYAEYPNANANLKFSIRSTIRNSIEPLKLSVSTNDTEFNGERTSRSKSDSIYTHRTSILSMQNESENSDSKLLDGSETSSAERSKAHSSTSRSQKAKDENNILNGFLSLVNKASNFWANKFTKGENGPIIEERRECDEPIKIRKQSSNQCESNASNASKSNDDMYLCIETQKMQICSNTDSNDDPISEKPSLESSKGIKEESDTILETKLNKKLSRCSTESNPDWKKLAKEMSSPSMSPQVLKDRFKNIKDSLPPKKTRFTHQEDLIIVKFYKKFGSNWESISKYLPERTPSMIKNRFYSSIKKKNLLSKLMSEVEEDDANSPEIKPEFVNQTQTSIQNNHINHKNIWNNPITTSQNIKLEEKIQNNELKHIESRDLYTNENNIDYYALTTKDASINAHPSLLCEPQLGWNNLNSNLYGAYSFDYPFMENELQYRIADTKNNRGNHIEHDGTFLEDFQISNIEHEKNEFFEQKFNEFDDSKAFNFISHSLDNQIAELHRNELIQGNILYTTAPIDYSAFKIEHNLNEIHTNNLEPTHETEEKINLLKTRISSIQSLFLETKTELEKLQKCFNQN